MLGFCWVFVRFLLDLIRVGWWSAHFWDFFRVWWDFVRVVWDFVRVVWDVLMVAL